MKQIKHPYSPRHPSWTSNPSKFTSSIEPSRPKTKSPSNINFPHPSLSQCQHHQTSINSFTHNYSLQINYGHSSRTRSSRHGFHANRAMAPLQPHKAPCPKPNLLHITTMVPNLQTQVPGAPPHHVRLSSLHLHGTLHWPQPPPALGPWLHHPLQPPPQLRTLFHLPRLPPLRRLRPRPRPPPLPRQTCPNTTPRLHRLRPATPPLPPPLRRPPRPRRTVPLATSAPYLNLPLNYPLGNPLPQKLLS